MKDMRETLVEINSASIEELVSISGIGANLAQRIIDQRPYSKLHDLVKVSGINETKLASLLPYLTLDKGDRKKSHQQRSLDPQIVEGSKPITKLGNTEAFVFLEDRNERQDALLIIFGGFILGLLLLLIRRSNQ